MHTMIDGLMAAQQPDWPDLVHLAEVTANLELLDPLVQPRETDQLTIKLAQAAIGKAFVLQAGYCAESFDDTAESQSDLLRVFLQMTVVLTYGAGVPVVKELRGAGQLGKPRSAKEEKHGDQVQPSFRGDIVNDIAFSESARRPNPDRMIRAYYHSKKTLQLLGELSTGDFADLEKIHEWNEEFVSGLDAGEVQSKYLKIVEGISWAIRFMKASGAETANSPYLHQAEMFSSHEGLILPYEMALTRKDNDGKLYDSSAHMLWIGERTRQLDGAHLAFFAAIENPIGVKLGPSTTADEVLELCDRLNPKRIPGRLTLIPRMGIDKIETALPPLLTAVRENDHPVVWGSDPMHGNTFSDEHDVKTRRFQDIVGELKGFFGACRSENVWPGGVHVEITGEDVTECLGGNEPNEVTILDENYTTKCDPRLNSTQSIDLAFVVADQLAELELS